MSQHVLPFKLEMTRDTITAHGGLALFGEFVHAMAVPSQIDQELPAPGSGAGYAPRCFVEPLLLMLHGGGRSLEDIRQIRQDEGLLELLKIATVPSTDALGDWLPRMGGGPGLACLDTVIQQHLRRALKRDDQQEYTLDIDATQIIAEKQAALKTYKGEIGYMPIVGHLAENGLIIGDEFREGNVPPAARNFEFIQHCVSRLTKGKRFSGLRADSAAYQHKIFNWCEEKGVEFAIGGDLDASVKKLIAGLTESSWRSFRDGHITEVVHSMNKTEKSFRLIIIRRPIQQDLFEEGEEPSHRYTLIASNREESAEETVAWYNKRGDRSENRIKDLKIGFGMERMPCGSFAGNAMFFRIGVMAYNLFVMFKFFALPTSWRKCQVQTIRWRLYQIAGKIVSHAGATILKVARCWFGLCDDIRTRVRELAVS